MTTTDTDDAGRFLDLNGASIYYEERGDGAPLILIHGGFSSGSDWAPIVPGLADRLRVITPDSRGHGRSTNPAAALSYARIADDVAALIAALGLRRPVVAGWSDGGQIALELGARHPGAAAALIVGAAFPDFDQGGLRDTHRALLASDDSDDADLQPPGGSEQWQALARHTASMWLDYQGLSPHELQAIRAPVLVLAGDRDEIVPLDLSISLYRTLPHAELAVCPALNHDGPASPRAALLTKLIEDFATRHAAA